MTLMTQVSQYMDAGAMWLRGTRLSWAVAGGYPWIWPLCETLHFIGLCLLFGIVGALDLRLLGVAKAIPIKPLQRMIPFAIAGFCVNAVTGLLFFVGAPFQYVHNYPFWLKMTAIPLAGLNVGVFQWFGLARVVDDIGPGGDAPFAAQVVAVTSLVLWVNVMFWGRMLPFLGNAF